VASLVLRVAKRRTAWDAGVAVEEIVAVEFTIRGELDLSISVYAIDEGQLVRTVAEHSAGAGLDPPRGSLGVNLDSARELTETPGDVPFAHAAAAHRELHFKDEADLTDFLTSVVLPTREERRREVTKEQFNQYLRERRQATDVEWSGVFEANPRWRKAAS
jgi:hypothetical protein